MTYDELLANAPNHQSPQFIQYLVENNRVVYKNAHWIVIENAKYHTKVKPWYTAFIITPDALELADLDKLNDVFGHLTWLKKSPKKQTVQRFHVHMYEDT
jgi:hypothetical protein